MDMKPATFEESHLKMLNPVKGLMLCRILILTFLLAITFVFEISEKRSFFLPLTDSFYYFLILFYLLTIFFALFLKKVTNLRKFIFIQIVIDHFFITGLVYFTGGKGSFFPITFIFSIIGSSIIFYKRGAFFSASLSTLLYGSLLLSQLYQWINPLGQSFHYDASQVFYSMITYMATFYIVAFLSSTISEELKKKKKELNQKEVDYNHLETFNRNIVQSLDSGLLTIDLTGKINFLNRTAEKILPPTNGEPDQLYIYDIFPKIQEVIDRLKNRSPASSYDYQRYETDFSNTKGEKIHLGFSISPLTDPEGALIGYTLIFQDITHFKELEEQMKRVDKMAAIGLLAAGMAHEIRNPLASLSGSIQMLKAELQLNEQQQHLMEITLRESERLNALIADFLLFAHPPQSNKMALEVIGIIEETVELFRHSPFCSENMEVIKTVPSEIIRAMGDPGQLKQVFWNLLINASQAMSDGGNIVIRVEKERENFWGTGLTKPLSRKEKEWVKVSITDSGKGISPEEKEKIFEPFFTTKESGTGLGLSIVHKIIESHRGIIKVDSEMGKGSTFTIYLPAEQPVYAVAATEGGRDDRQQDFGG
jgi:two-component system, NtrC family, sensor histidine kinase PilS